VCYTSKQNIHVYLIIERKVQYQSSFAKLSGWKIFEIKVS